MLIYVIQQLATAHSFAPIFRTDTSIQLITCMPDSVHQNTAQPHPFCRREITLSLHSLQCNDREDADQHPGAPLTSSALEHSYSALDPTGTEILKEVKVRLSQGAFEEHAMSATTLPVVVPVQSIHEMLLNFRYDGVSLV